MRKPRKVLAILAAVALLVTMLVPMATPAFAGTGAAVLQVPNVSDNAWQQLGTVKIECDVGAIDNGHVVTATLPSGFKFYDKTSPWSAEFKANVGTYILFNDNGAGGGTAGDGLQNGSETIWARVVIPKTYGGNDNDLWGPSSNVSCLNVFNIAALDENELQITVQNYTNSGNQNIFYIYLDSIFIKDGFSGDIKLTATKPSNSGFPAGELVVGRVPGGKVDITALSVDTFSDSDQVQIRVNEQTAGSLEKYTDSLKFILPSGFEFANFTAAPAGYVALSGYLYYKEIWGNNSATFGAPSLNSDKNELKINVTGESTQATNFEFIVNIAVSDESKAKTGDVTMRIRGSSTYSPSELIVGTYGEYETSVAAKDAAPTVVAGKYDAEISDIIIKESVAGSFVNGRSITLQLPSGVKWTKVDAVGTDSGLTLNYSNVVGTDGRTIKYTVAGPSTDAAEITLEDFEVAIDPEFTGDIKVKVGGTAGLSGEIVVAKAVSPIEVSATVQNVQIGSQGQAAGDITITEHEAGAIGEDKDIIVDLPAGVAFTSTPTVEVTEGDLSIDSAGVKTQNDGNELVIPIDSDSNDASTIKISNIKYTVDRTVAEGNITVKFKGEGLMPVNDSASIAGEAFFVGPSGIDIDSDGTADYDISGTAAGGNLAFFPAVTSAASVVNAKTVTPAPGEMKAEVAFKINDTKFTVGGVEQTMDVAPYIKDGRTFLPVRYVAQACGVAPENILFSEGKVTLIKGDKVIQLTLGSNVMVINGVSINMDVAAELSNDRTMLPFRWIAQALGATVTWDEATQTVTMTM